MACQSSSCLLTALLLLLLASCHGFQFGGTTPTTSVVPTTLEIKHNLLQMIDEMGNDNNKLQVHLDIGKAEEEHTGGSRLAIRDMEIQLLSSQQQCGAHVMPGRSHCLSSSHVLEITSPGSFTTMNGLQTPSFCTGTSNSSWELVWRDHAGTLICGFLLSDTLQRNDAVLESGPFYVSFPVWSKVGLVAARDYQQQVRADVDDALQQRQLLVDQANRAWNPIEKSVLYNKIQTLQDEITSQWSVAKESPPSPDNVVELLPDVHVSKKGFVFKVAARKGKSTYVQTYERLGYAYCKRGGSQVKEETRAPRP